MFSKVSWIYTMPYLKHCRWFAIIKLNICRKIISIKVWDVDSTRADNKLQSHSALFSFFKQKPFHAKTVTRRKKKCSHWSFWVSRDRTCFGIMTSSMRAQLRFSCSSDTAPVSVCVRHGTNRFRQEWCAPLVWSGVPWQTRLRRGSKHFHLNPEN